MAIRFGTGQADSLTGADGTDWIFGFGGQDTLVGGLGSDWIFGGHGNDLIFGDAKDGPGPVMDPEVHTAPGSNFIHAGGGADTVYAGYGADTVFGGGGDDLIFGYGGPIGQPSVFALYIVHEGPDFLDGGAGSDTITGGGGADTLRGGSGRDVLDGHRGVDLLLGGEDADVFVFSRFRGRGAMSPDTGIGEGNRDVIADFRRGEDLIDLSGYRNRIGPSEEPIFLGGEAFEERVALQVRVELLESGNTLVQVFSPIGSAPEPDLSQPFFLAEIELLGAVSLGRDDFIL